jgi:CBS domain-containing protein
MSKAKEIMHWGAECVAASDTLETAARMMRDDHGWRAGPGQAGLGRRRRRRRRCARLMEEHQIRRLPVIEERRLAGMISEADLATHLPEAKIAEFAYRVYSAPPSR